MNLHLSNKDALDWLKSLKPNSVDLWITDFPYSSLDKHRNTGTTPRLVAWFPTISNARFPEILSEMYRTLKNDRHCYIMCDSETMFVMKPMAESVGFKFWKPLIWDKVQIGMGYHYRNRCEFVLFFEKGKRNLQDLGIADVLPFQRVRNGYPTEKPLGLLEILVRQSSYDRELVGDPFMGSGSTGEAALSLGRRFIGNDISEESIDVAGTRLEGFR